MTEKSIFETLNAINVNDHVEKKSNLSYLSWAWAWSEVKKAYPEATYTIYENADGWNYFTDGRTGWVKTGVTINGLEMVEYLPIMDFRNKSIPIDNITSFDVNKTIQRSLTKACARHGLGLYIYAGEDLPESDSVSPTETKKPSQAKIEPKKDKSASDVTELATKEQIEALDSLYTTRELNDILKRASEHYKKEMKEISSLPKSVAQTLIDKKRKTA